MHVFNYNSYSKCIINVFVDGEIYKNYCINFLHKQVHKTIKFIHSSPMF